QIQKGQEVVKTFEIPRYSTNMDDKYSDIKDLKFKYALIQFEPFAPVARDEKQDMQDAKALCDKICTAELEKSPCQFYDDKSYNDYVMGDHMKIDREDLNEEENKVLNGGMDDVE